LEIVNIHNEPDSWPVIKAMAADLSLYERRHGMDILQ